MTAFALKSRNDGGPPKNLQSNWPSTSRKSPVRSISGWQTHPLRVRRREIVKITAELFRCNRFPQMHGREKLVNRSGNCETLQGEQLREFTFSRDFHEAFTSQGEKKSSHKPSSLLTSSPPGSLTFTLSRRVLIGSAPDVGRMTGARLCLRHHAGNSEPSKTLQGRPHRSTGFALMPSHCGKAKDKNAVSTVQTPANTFWLPCTGTGMLRRCIHDGVRRWDLRPCRYEGRAAGTGSRCRCP